MSLTTLNKRFRSKVKSLPWLYGRLNPCVQRWRNLWYRTTRSKAQYFRDCCYALSRSLTHAYFVNVGANDGIMDTPGIRILLGNANWHGLLIEPVPYCYAKLQCNFKDKDRFRLEQVAIGPAAGKAIFYYVDESATRNLPELPNWYDKLGSFSRDHIVKHMGPKIEPYIVEETVDVQPLTTVVRRNGLPKIDLLHIDTEGYDLNVLKTLDFSVYRPIIVYIEHIHLSFRDKREMRRLLRYMGYTLYDCGMDYFALHKKQYKDCIRLSNIG